jgi:hypothetical protein
LVTGSIKEIPLDMLSATYNLPVPISKAKAVGPFPTVIFFILVLFDGFITETVALKGVVVTYAGGENC